MNFCFRLVCLFTALLMATHAMSQDLSGWSDKTVCRQLLNNPDNTDYLEEADSRGLTCGSSTQSSDEFIDLEKAKTNKSPNFQIINLTDLDDNYFIDKANYASSQMTNVITQTLALIYPVGTFIDYKINPNNEVDFLGTVKVSHEIVLKDWQIEEALDEARKFFASQDCLNNLSYMSMLDDINWVLANGYASGLQAVMCDDVRFIMMSIDPWEREKKSKNLIVFALLSYFLCFKS